MTKLGGQTHDWGIESAYKEEHVLPTDNDIVVVQIDNANIAQIKHAGVIDSI